MNPLQTKIQTSAGMETPQETLARARAMTTPTTGTFSVKVPNAVPSTALTQGSTIADVRNTRNQMEQSQLQQTQLGTDYNTLQSSINAPIQGTPISNPDAYINQLLLSRPTETQNQLDQAGQNQADMARGFANDYTKTVNTANEQFGVPQLQKNLAETRKQIADRTVQLRNDLRQFEVNAKERGVAREYVNDAKQKVQADAAAQLADLSIIENAQVGNIAQANAEIDRLLQNKRTAYELQNNAMEAEIKRLTAMDTREGDQRAKQLTVALQERKQNIETQLANEKETRQYMMEAAANGADHGTLAAIQNAKTPGEALLAAGSWLGRLDFDPSSAPEPLDPTTKRQLENSVQSGGRLLDLASQYKKLIDEHGFTNTIAGDTETLGKIESLRAQMTSEYKNAAQLGTLDTGVLTLVSSIIGEEPTSTWNPFTNITGRPAAKLSSQIGSFIDQQTKNRAEDMHRLGIDPTSLSLEDESAIDSIFGTTSTSTDSNFNPSSYFK